MRRHSIDPLSAVLGLAATAAGIIVAVGRADSFTDDAAWWIALLALLLGVALVPWNRRSVSAAPVVAPATYPTGHPMDEGTMAPAPQTQRFDYLQLPPADSER